ncbi:hypothetical protein GCM10010443_83640 [Actinoplanes cyaneus]
MDPAKAKITVAIMVTTSVVRRASRVSALTGKGPASALPTCLTSTAESWTGSGVAILIGLPHLQHSGASKQDRSLERGSFLPAPLFG